MAGGEYEPVANEPSVDALLLLFDAMTDIRAFETVTSEAHRRGELPGLIHVSNGAEACAVGVIGALAPRDRIYSGHRAHGHFLAAGVNARALFAELAGRDTGLCRGRAGSMHLMDERAVMATGVVGGTLPIALGHALAVDAGDIVAVFFGDGAVQAGIFHETINLASLWQAPLLFVCENNGVAEFSSRDEHTAVADVASYGELFSIPSARVDGADVIAVRAAARTLVESVRAGKGPALLECVVSRLRPHYEGDLRAARSGRDPLAQLAGRLTSESHGLSPAALQRRVDEAITRAQAELATVLAEDPVPDPSLDEGLVFARAPGQ